MLESLDPGTISAGQVLRLVRNGEANTRTELARLAGLSRSTLAERVQTLLALELLDEVTGVESTGGRPPATLAFNSSAGVVLVADLDGSLCRAAVSDLSRDAARRGVLRIRPRRLPPADGLDAIHARFAALLRAAGVSIGQVWGIGIGVPAPVTVGGGEPVAQGVLPGWDGFSIPRWFAPHYDAPALVDNHVNLSALGEHWTYWRDVDHLLYVMIGAGIGCGIVSDGRVHRGAQGSAGDIGHIRRCGTRRSRLPLREHGLPGGRRRRRGARGAAAGGRPDRRALERAT